MTPRRILAAAGWYLRELTGEAAYGHYVERHRRLHPDAPLLARREFERRRVDRQDENPGTRCC